MLVVPAHGSSDALQEKAAFAANNLQYHAVSFWIEYTLCLMSNLTNMSVEELTLQGNTSKEIYC